MQVKDGSTDLLTKEILSHLRRQKWQKIPSFSTETTVGRDFHHWLETTAGGRKSKSQATKICSRALKFTKFCFEDHEDDDDQMVDHCLGSSNLICQFLDAMDEVNN